MRVSEPPQAATEEATVRLPHLAFLEIRFLAAESHDDQSADAVDQRRNVRTALVSKPTGTPDRVTPSEGNSA